MVLCAMIGCGNRSQRDKEKSYYRLPSVISLQGSKTYDLSKKRREEWLARIKREDIKKDQFGNIRVCSDHFISGAPAKLYDVNNPDWAPSLKLGYKSSQSTSGDSTQRYTRIVQRNSRKRAREEDNKEGEKRDDVEQRDERDDAEQRDDVEQSIEDAGNKDVEGGKAVQTDMTSQDIMKLECESQYTEQVHKEMENEIGRLKKEVDELVFKEEAFRNNNDKVLFYTGVTSWELFDVLFQYVKPQLKKYSALSPFQQLISTLMRLRLGLSGQDLAYRFRVHTATISRTFMHVLDVLYWTLKPVIIWPDRDALKKTMPMDFRKHFPNCVVIIDCFEIFLDRPTNLLARAQTFSSYKHHNTVKYLIGITPQGTVSFISEGWGGRTSNKYLTEHCSLLNHLVPGDMILADRGFDISDSVGFYCSTLKMPAFTKSKNN